MLKCLLVGNIGSEPEMRYSSAGNPFLRFSVASNGRVRDQSGEWKDETTWVRVTVLGKRAETLQALLHKGMKIYADGRLEAKPWTGQNGQVNAVLELVANEVEFMQPRETGRGASDDDDDQAF